MNFDVKENSPYGIFIMIIDIFFPLSVGTKAK